MVDHPSKQSFETFFVIVNQSDALHSMMFGLPDMDDGIENVNRGRCKLDMHGMQIQ
jgi:hypothetical protein